MERAPFPSSLAAQVANAGDLAMDTHVPEAEAAARGPQKKLLKDLAARTTLHVYSAATPASLITPSTGLAARSLLLYLGLS